MATVELALVICNHGEVNWPIFSVSLLREGALQLASRRRASLRHAPSR